MAQARREKLGVFDTLDIGGGYPIEYGQKVADIGRFCAPIRAALAKLPARLRVIAEPGRYICGPAAIGVASVMGRAKREGHWWYYLDDGLYGSYSGQLFDHAKYPVESLKESDEKFPSVLAGPTCDSIDVIAENLMLPALKAGDLIVGRAMGAYTWASASEFNFFPKATVVSVNRQAGGHRLGDAAPVLTLAPAKPEPYPDAPLELEPDRAIALKQVQDPHDHTRTAVNELWTRRLFVQTALASGLGSRSRASHSPRREAVSETPASERASSCATRTPARPCSVVYRRGDEYDADGDREAAQPPARSSQWRGA